MLRHGLIAALGFLDEAKSDGTVGRALDGNGFTSDKVAP